MLGYACMCVWEEVHTSFDTVIWSIYLSKSEFVTNINATSVRNTQVSLSMYLQPVISVRGTLTKAVGEELTYCCWKIDPSVTGTENSTILVILLSTIAWAKHYQSLKPAEHLISMSIAEYSLLLRITSSASETA